MWTRNKVVLSGATTTINDCFSYLIMRPDARLEDPRGGYWKTSTANTEFVRVCEVPMQQRLPLPCWNYESSTCSDLTQSIMMAFNVVLAWFISPRLFIFRCPEHNTPSRRCISDRPSFYLWWGSHLRRPLFVSPSRRSLPNKCRPTRLTRIMLPLSNAVPNVSSRGIAEVRLLSHPPAPREGRVKCRDVRKF